MSLEVMKAPEGFTPLGSNISYWEPKETSSKPAGFTDPELVVLCSWMGARPQHIAKYTATYQKLLPHARIILVQSHILDMTYRSAAKQQQTLSPATQLVVEVVRDSVPGERVPMLLHVFSHGGSNSSIQLLKAVASAESTERPLPIQGFVLDSTPGAADYWRSFEAVATTLPKAGLLRLLGVLSIHLTLWITYALTFFGLSAGISELRNKLLDTTLYSSKTPRTYLYSKADRMVDWKLVQKHAEEAEAVGYTVRQHCFEASSHCGHIREDGNIYWSAVQALWT